MAKKAYFEFGFKDSSLENNLDNMAEKATVALLMLMSTEAARVECQMKRERPWFDRTGDAKESLTARVSQPSRNKIRMTLSHGVDYGIWLELANEKKYAIIAPTLNKEGPVIENKLKGFMYKIGGTLK